MVPSGSQARRCCERARGLWTAGVGQGPWQSALPCMRGARGADARACAEAAARAAPTAPQYVSDVDNLCLMMNLLKDQSRSIQFEAFHVFKVGGRAGGRAGPGPGAAGAGASIESRSSGQRWVRAGLSDAGVSETGRSASAGGR